MKNIISPPFLNRINQFLLLRYPLIWSSRIHYVAWYTILIWAVILLFSLVSNPNGLSDSFVGTYWTLASLSVLFLLIFWLNHLFKHNATKSHGNRNPGREWINMVAHFMCLVLISSILYAYPAMTYLKGKAMIKSMGVVDDINKLNAGRIFFPQYNNNEKEEYSIASDNILFLQNYSRGFYIYQLEQLEDGLNKDSFNEKLWYSIIGNDAKINEVITGYLKVAKDYYPEYPYTIDDIRKRISSNYAFKLDPEFVENNMKMNYAVDKKLRKLTDAYCHFSFVNESEFYFIWLLIVLPIVLIILTISRNVSLRFLLMSIGIGLLLIILNSIFMGLFVFSNMDKSNTEFIITSFFIVWTIILIFINIQVYQQKEYNSINAVSVVIFNLLLPLLPSIFMSIYIGSRAFNDYYYDPLGGYNIDYQYTKEFLMKVSVYMGLFLIFISQQLYFKPLYERLWTMPKKQ